MPRIDSYFFSNLIFKQTKLQHVPKKFKLILLQKLGDHKTKPQKNNAIWVPFFFKFRSSNKTNQYPHSTEHFNSIKRIFRIFQRYKLFNIWYLLIIFISDIYCYLIFYCDIFSTFQNIGENIRISDHFESIFQYFRRMFYFLIIFKLFQSISSEFFFINNFRNIKKFLLRYAVIYWIYNYHLIHSTI